MSTNVDEQKQSMRRSHWEAQTQAMREGRRERAHTFRSKKGKGSYKRKGKHGGWD